MSEHCPGCNGERVQGPFHLRPIMTCPGLPAPEVEAVVESARKWKAADDALMVAAYDEWEQRSEAFYGAQEVLRSAVSAVQTRGRCRDMIVSLDGPTLKPIGEDMRRSE